MVPFRNPSVYAGFQPRFCEQITEYSEIKLFQPIFWGFRKIYMIIILILGKIVKDYFFPTRFLLPGFCLFPCIRPHMLYSCRPAILSTDTILRLVGVLLEGFECFDIIIVPDSDHRRSKHSLQHLHGNTITTFAD